MAIQRDDKQFVDRDLKATRVAVVSGGGGGGGGGGLTDAELRASAVPVSGPLTNTQLRATPVPVSGTVATGGLTDTQLRAAPIPVSGTVGVTGTQTDALTDTQLRASPVTVAGPLTDTQLRASAVPVSGTVTATPPASVQRTTTITRLTGGTDLTILAGAKSYTVTVITAASGASPTLDGVALPAGYSPSFSAPLNDTLEAAAILTVPGDDVLVLEVR